MEIYVLLLILGPCLLPVVIVGAVQAIRKIKKKKKIQACEKVLKERYGISLEMARYVDKVKEPENPGYFELGFPRWSVPRVDGTKDRRIKNNYIVSGMSVLHIDEYVISIRDPMDMLAVVHNLRSKGVKILPCKEEKAKAEAEARRAKATVSMNDIQVIIEKFSEVPTNFEVFCAVLFENLGYTANVTSATNDGGYDILMKKDEEVGIAECKCYAITNKIGRPAVQKLVGAGMTMHTDFLYFITTSSFTSEAISYAKQTGVTLIDGTELMRLVELSNKSADTQQQEPPELVELTKEDMRQYVAPDVYEIYFGG